MPLQRWEADPNPHPHPNPKQRWEADAWGDRGGGGAHDPNPRLEALAGGAAPLQHDHRERLQGLAQHKGEAQRRQDAQIGARSRLDLTLALTLALTTTLTPTPTLPQPKP